MARVAKVVSKGQMGILSFGSGNHRNCVCASLEINLLSSSHFHCTLLHVPEVSTSNNPLAAYSTWGLAIVILDSRSNPGNRPLPERPNGVCERQRLPQAPALFIVGFLLRLVLRI